MASISRSLAILIAVSLLAQLLVWGLVWGVSRAHNLNFPSLTGDSNHYRILAENLIQKRAFDTFPGRPSPDSFRTPGYPLFLAALFAVARSWAGAVFLQAALMSLTGALVYILGRRVLGEKAALAAGFLAALDPVRLFYSTLTLSDALFVLLLVLSLVIFLSAARAGGGWRMLAAGLVLGWAVLVRPIGQFLPVLFLFFIFMRKSSSRALLIKMAGLFIIGFLVIVGPWSVRNQITFGSWQLSSVGSFNAAYFAMLYRQETTGESPGRIQAEILESAGRQDPIYLRSLESNAVLTRYARNVFFQEPAGYMSFHAVKTIPFFLNDGLRDISRLLGFSHAPMPNITRLLADGDYTNLYRLLTASKLDFTLFILGTSLLGALFLLAVYGSFVLLKNRESRLLALLLISLILYFAVLTGPVANARYRMPAMPFLILLATCGAEALWRRSRRQSIAGEPIISFGR